MIELRLTHKELNCFFRIYNQPSPYFTNLLSQHIMLQFVQIYIGASQHSCTTLCLPCLSDSLLILALPICFLQIWRYMNEEVYLLEEQKVSSVRTNVTIRALQYCKDSFFLLLLNIVWVEALEHGTEPATALDWCTSLTWIKWIKSGFLVNKRDCLRTIFLKIQLRGLLQKNDAELGGLYGNLTGLARKFPPLVTFYSYHRTVACRPYFIDWSTIETLLPCDDEYWYASNPIASGPLKPDPSETWKSLQDSPNQSAHAWFLLANHLMSCAHTALLRRDGTDRLSPETLALLESASACFEMALPTEFQDDMPLQFTEESRTRDNWVVCLHLMHQGYSTVVNQR